jgi:predicted transcriptional regulator
MNEPTADAELIDLTADIVSAYVSNNTVPAGDLPALTRSSPPRAV